MVDIKVGMYVRTNYGIAKIIKTDFINEYLDKPFLVVDRELEIGLIGGNDESLCDKKDIIGEASFNIIDLIEVGDYVNDYKILDMVDVKDSNEKAFTIFQHKGTDTIYFYSNEDIKSIVTKEQFESVEYEVE